MIKAKNWSGKDLKGEWQITIKIDGVRALWNPGRDDPGDQGWYSRNGKPLYNIPAPGWRSRHHDVEVYCGGFKATIERTRAKTKSRPISPGDLYSLDPLDQRLFVTVSKDPTAERIQGTMRDAIKYGYEGLVLRQGDVWLKVKPTETFDVPVTGIIEGTGKHKGRMGALMTPMGKVGTGFSDAERVTFWNYCKEPDDGRGIMGETIEVECMQLTDDGKFRHPRFVRLRPDK